MDRRKPIYLDYNATTPHTAEVIEAIRPYLEEHFGNPSSSHWYGIKAKEAVEEARIHTANLINCKPHEIIFTSGGTESNNYAIKGAAFTQRKNGNHIITSGIEHPAVMKVCGFLEKRGFKITYLPVDEYGMINIGDVEKAITSKTILITVMHANNEVGTMQPIKEIAKITRKMGILFHTDAAQSIGKIPTDVKILGVDLLSIAGHKLYAPKGVGALYIRNGVKLEKFIHGAGQEEGWRPGTENVTGIAGIGKACEIANRDLRENTLHMKKMRDRLYEGLKDKWQDIKVNGHPEKRLPNTLNISFYGMKANKLLFEIREQVAASAGAACHYKGVEVSDVIRAMNVPPEWAKGTLRFSVGRMTTNKEIERAIEIILCALKKLRGTKNKT